MCIISSINISGYDNKEDDDSNNDDSMNNNQNDIYQCTARV